MDVWEESMDGHSLQAPGWTPWDLVVPLKSPWHHIWWWNPGLALVKNWMSFPSRPQAYIPKKKKSKYSKFTYHPFAPRIHFPGRIGWRSHVVKSFQSIDKSRTRGLYVLVPLPFTQWLHCGNHGRIITYLASFVTGCTRGPFPPLLDDVS